MLTTEQVYKRMKHYQVTPDEGRASSVRVFHHDGHTFETINGFYREAGQPSIDVFLNGTSFASGLPNWALRTTSEYPKAEAKYQKDESLEDWVIRLYQAMTQPYEKRNT